MKARTELLLYRIEWMAGKALRPTWRSLDSSFESWAYGSGYLRQIQRLEAQAFLETRKDPESGKRLIRLTEKGTRVCGLGTDPEERWQRDWDEVWRMVIFDVPERDRNLRGKLRNRLVGEGFGCLQQSVWISPNPFGGLLDELRGEKVEAGSLTLMEARPAAGEKPVDLAGQAWNFDTIRRVWHELAEHLDLANSLSTEGDRRGFIKWIERERELILKCFRVDPLLPRVLHPADYPGPKVWKQREVVLSRMSNAKE